MAVTVASLSEAGTELTASSFVRNEAGKRQCLRFRRTVPASDLRSARTQVLGFATQDVATVPGTTSLGPSLLVMDELRQEGQVEFKVRNYADRRDNAGTLRRIGIDSLPMLLNGRRVVLPAVHVRGQLGPAGHRRPWSCWFFDHPAQPFTLKVSYGAEGASETAPAEWLRQVIRIDIPDEGGGAGAGVALSPVGPGGHRDGVQVAGPEGSLPGSDGIPLGSGLGAGGLGAMAGMTRDLTATCRVSQGSTSSSTATSSTLPPRRGSAWSRRYCSVIPTGRSRIEGHTDSIGDPHYN